MRGGLNACGRDKAHNRELFFDDYVLLTLLAVFNPILDTLRTLQMASDLEEVRRRLGINKRINLGFPPRARSPRPRTPAVWK